MRKKIAVLLILLLSLCSCGPNISNYKTENSVGKYSNTASSGVWISFREINSMLTSGDGFENELKKVVENCESLKIENVYIHVRSYCDSLYPSDFFPLISEAEVYDYDIFKKMLDAFHQSGIKVHAWINPYRVLTSSSDIEKLDSNSPAYIWLNDDNADNDINVCFYKGIYLNPAESEVRQLVIDGIREILSKYEVDGIHFDDYFYPTKDSDFDSKSYEKYKSVTANPLSVEDWRRANVNALISGCYSAVKYANKDVLFSISPAASLDKNYNEFYADIEEWIKNGYVDYLIPQLYFGFEYPQKEYCFESLLEEWRTVINKNTEVGLFVGLASYKIGADSEYDKEEWQNNTDIIARQARICYDDGLAQGYVIFSYSSLFSDSELNSKQREELIEFINCKTEGEI